MISANGPRTGRAPAFGKRGMASSPHYLATASGENILRRGGSAVDAAIAVNATLCVVYPHMASIGGDGFWLIAGGKADGVEAIEANGQAAALATREFYKENGHTESIPMRGPLSVLTTPGAIDGWRIAHERHGKLPWADLFADAIHYAREGAAVTRTLADWSAVDAPLLKDDPKLAEIFLPDGKPRREGDIFTQNDLADTLEAIAQKGAREGFYEGQAARDIGAAMEKAGSPLRYEDFSSYEARWVEPLKSSYRGYDIFQLPPPTQGFAAQMILNIMETFDVASWGWNSVEYYHHLAEATKVAFADRDEWLTDPRHCAIPLDTFLSKDYAKKRSALISRDTALPVEGIEPGLRYGDDAKRKGPDGGTVYFCTADADGMMVSIIQSPYHDFGSCVIAGDTGVLMQNRGCFFSLDAGHPNTLEPGKRTFHTIIPAMLMQDDKPVMAYGTMGGEGQPQTQASIITRMVDFGFNVQQAIEAPRWLMGRTWGTASRDLLLEPQIPAEVIRELTLLGHPVKMATEWNGSLGHAQAIRYHADTGLYEGGADPRGDGTASGF